MSPLDLFAERRPMHKSLFCRFATAAMFCTAPSSAQTYKTYHEPRFGTTADVPADWQSNLAADERRWPDLQCAGR
jgi:hypothetical protein